MYRIWHNDLKRVQIFRRHFFKTQRFLSTFVWGKFWEWEVWRRHSLPSVSWIPITYGFCNGRLQQKPEKGRGLLSKVLWSLKIQFNKLSTLLNTNLVKQLVSLFQIFNNHDISPVPSMASFWVGLPVGIVPAIQMDFKYRQVTLRIFGPVK